MAPRRRAIVDAFASPRCRGPSQLWELVRHSFDRTFERPCQVPRATGVEAGRWGATHRALRKFTPDVRRDSGRRPVTDRVRTERAQGQPLAMAEVNPRRDWIALRVALATLGLGLMASLSWPPSCSALNLENRLAPVETAAGKLATTTEHPAEGFLDETLLLALETRGTAPGAKTSPQPRAADAEYLRVVLRGHADAVVSAQFSRDGRTALTCSWDKTARLWEVASGRELRTLRGHGDRVVSAQFSPDGTMALTASDDRTARLWDVVRGKELQTLQGHENAVVSAQFSADGKLVLTASWDKTARLWDTASGKELRILRGHENAVASAQFSPDGKTALTASWDNTARLWDVASGKELRILRGHENPLGGAQFSPDGKVVLTVSDDKTARLWDVASGKELRALRGHADRVASAQFSADGKTVLTTSRDRTARLWDAASGKELRVLRGHSGGSPAPSFPRTVRPC